MFMTDNTENSPGNRKWEFDREGMQGMIEALQWDDASVRRFSAMMLGTTKDPQAVAPLVAALADPEKDVRCAATKALSVIGSAAVDALATALRDTSWIVRYRAAEAIGDIDDPRANTLLITCLEDEKDHVRYMGAKGLGRKRLMVSVSPLIGALDDENEYVRIMVATSLAAIGGTEALEALSGRLAVETVPGCPGGSDEGS